MHPVRPLRNDVLLIDSSTAVTNGQSSSRKAPLQPPPPPPQPTKQRRPPLLRGRSSNNNTNNSCSSRRGNAVGGLLHRASSLQVLPACAPKRQSSFLRRKGMRRAHSFQEGPRREINVYLPGAKEPIKRSLSVRFAKMAEVKRVSQVDPRDIPQIWWRDMDYDVFSSKIHHILRQVEEGTDVKYCTRGLEHLMDDKEEEKKKRFAAFCSVFSEQEEQRREGRKFDDVSISKLYRRATAEHGKVAARRARRDAAEIEKYTADTRRMIRKLDTSTTMRQ